MICLMGLVEMLLYYDEFCVHYFECASLLAHGGSLHAYKLASSGSSLHQRCLVLVVSFQLHGLWCTLMK